MAGGLVKVEEQYFDVLQNLETAIVTAYDQNPRLLDLDVMDALNALIRSYTLEERGVSPRLPTVSGPSRSVLDLTRRICEWRLGRQPLNPADPGVGRLTTGYLSVGELILCLKRIRNSVRLWTERGGRQGYLDYVRHFLEDARRRAGT
jgi:hypothetical protein